MEENYFAYFPGNYRWSAGLLLALATAPWGSGDIGEIDRIGKRLRTNSGNDEAWFQEWSRMGETLQQTAEEASHRGHPVTASGFFQRACMYYQVGERFRQPKDQQAMEDARACYEAVGSKDKTFKVFTAKEGGSQHCQIDYLGVALPYMHDWLAEKLRS